MKTIAILVLVVYSANSSAQVFENSYYNDHGRLDSGAMKLVIEPSSSMLSVSGLLNVKADSYAVVFTVIQVAETAIRTKELMRNRIDKFFNEAKKLNIDTASIQIEMISFVPKYRYEDVGKMFSSTFNEEPDGFELQKSITVQYKNSSMFDGLVSAAGNAEIYDIAKVDYFVDDLTKTYEVLRTACFELIKSRIKSYEQLGFKLDTMEKTFAEGFSTITPQNRYARHEAISRPSLDAVNDLSNLKMKLKGRDRAESKYYNPVSYHKYDIVINPTVDEPVVQLAYKIDIRFHD